MGKMPEVDIATLETVSIREVWPDEARDLTPWLAANPQLLSDYLGMDLELEGQEMGVGQFSADLVFRDLGSNSRVVVENMIAATDHDHLGKLITYGAGLDANYVVLLAERFRPEHRTALTWLNTISEDGFGFFGLELEILRIDDSRPAPSLRPVVQPDDWHRTAKSAKTQMSETEQLYFGFWSEFLPDFHEAHPGWSRSTKAQSVHWASFPSGRSGVGINAAFCRPDKYRLRAEIYRLRAEIYIDGGEAESNHGLFNGLYAQKARIEDEIGKELDWDPLETKRACRISLYFPGGIRVRQRERWPEAREWLIEALGKMRRAFGPILTELP
ncbi:MAG: DUF4268 domain-containing protein [Acidimicrobiaceae bacterium]|nr:DUF4268 domain-containing protein [Acidimicrobiaceae bacterium]MXW76842.1 DUF4268 domain-containing protein [Acidimicrobiaceae bacterium]MYA75190.1 DUF4268 domain-containing protein [Acidimicrobiaceae bacterium]MYC41807.1 DUF4268 domain-containing protein [Acidimicrobiaceae bacterium]MYD07830.1 DUF4268 domain-containing protein [Acidimicrobiaceae bacterium]